MIHTSFIASWTFIYGTGQDFDMTDFEVLRFDQSDVKSLPSQTTSESGSMPVTPSLSLESSPPSTPSPPPSPSAPQQPEEVGIEAQATSNSPQLRLIRRKAPEVYGHVDVAAQLLSDSNSPPRVAIYSPIH